jgi:hypothetical protein
MDFPDVVTYFGTVYQADSCRSRVTYMKRVAETPKKLVGRFWLITNCELLADSYRTCRRHLNHSAFKIQITNRYNRLLIYHKRVFVAYLHLLVYLREVLLYLCLCRVLLSLHHDCWLLSGDCFRPLPKDLLEKLNRRFYFPSSNAVVLTLVWLE